MLFGSLSHTLLLVSFVLLDLVAFVWLMRVVRARLANGRRQRAAAGVAWNRKMDWVRALDEEESAVVVSVDAGRITIVGGHNWPEPLELALVTTVSMVVSNRTGGVRRYMEFRADRTRRVPARAHGFAELVERLRLIPGFDDGQMQEALQATENQRFTILAVPLPLNARLLHEPEHAGQWRNDFGAGLCLLRAGGDVLVSWDVTYDELGRVPGVELARDEYDLAYWKLGRVRSGGLVLDDLRVRMPRDRTDVPVLSWQTAAVLTQGGDENYRLLKGYFHSVMQEALHDYASYERADQKAQRWLTAGVRVGLVYWYNAENWPESRYCSLTFENAREYPQHLQDAYTAGVLLDRVHWQRFVVQDVRVERNFRASRWVRQTPGSVRTVVAGKDGYVVWCDEAAGMIGFADESFAVVAEAARAARLELQNVSPGKGGGYAQLLLVDDAGKRVKVAESRYQGLDAAVGAVAELVGLQVTTLQEFNDS